MRTSAWPLRHRFLAVLLGLSAAGLAVFAVAGVLLLERSLLSRVDDQLTDLATPLSERPSPVLSAQGMEEIKLPTQFNVAFHQADGTLLARLPEDAAESPSVPAAMLASPPDGPVTVPGGSGEGSWRVMVVRMRDGGRASVGMSLESTRSTVHQLMVIEAVAGTVLLAVLGAAALVAVRIGLRPLTRMEWTAAEIARGRVERRLVDIDPRTEIGRLGGTLNTMLEHLALALSERERSEERLRHFVADASHELRTPLTSILGFAGLYRQGRAARDPAAERLLARIEAEAARMGVLVEDLLLLARLDREPRLNAGTVDLHVLAADVVHAAHARDRGRPIELRPSLLPVCTRGDEHRLHQVIANLVANAMTHTPAGCAVRVRVACLPDAGPAPGVVHRGTGPEPGDVAVIEVGDEGPGIAAEHLPHVFDRFYRTDAARSRASGGTGLGLAIAAALVQAHGGRVEVRSDPSGTVFRVLLPFTSC